MPPSISITPSTGRPTPDLLKEFADLKSQTPSGNLQPFASPAKNFISRPQSHQTGKPNKPEPLTLQPPQEQLVDLMQQLTDQKVALRERQRKEDAATAKAARKEASARAGRFVLGDPWRHPKAVPDEFSVCGRLPSKYLLPAKYARSYQKGITPPFMDADSVPRIFGDAPELPPHVQPTLLGQTMHRNPRHRKKGSTLLEIETTTPRLRRSLRISQADSTQTPRTWQLPGAASNELSTRGYLDERASGSQTVR